MKKRIQVFKDGRQGFIMGDMDIRFGRSEVVKEYEIEMEDKVFEKMMEEPDKIKVDKIKNKREVPIKEINEKVV